MKVELCLKELLEEKGLYKHGVETRISQDTGLHRHTVGKMLRNRMRNPSIEAIGKVSKWLTVQGVPANILPGALFRSRPPSLWKGFGTTQKVTIYLGEYRHTRSRKEAVPMRRMVALHDAEVGSMIIGELTNLAARGEAGAVVNTRYLPFQFSPAKPSVNGAFLDADIKRAFQMFQEVQNRGKRDSVIMLGSQRVNYLVECMVADLFDCKPFEVVTNKPRVPFYLCYRGFDRKVPSCFGGNCSPPGDSRGPKRGTYYIDESNKWISLGWDQKLHDAGIVIVIRESERIEMSVIGFSGRATSALGVELIENPELFWPEEFELLDPEQQEEEKKRTAGRKKKKREKPATTIELNGKEIGIYVCKVTFSNGSIDENHLIEDDFKVDTVDVIPLGAKVLNKFLRKKKKRK